NPESLNSNAALDSGDDVLPRIATDGLGNWVAVWPSDDTLGGTIGPDNEILTARFALPDCNANLIGDAFETANGISPDINNNRIPDICDVLGLPPAQPTGCGGGLCGAGTAMLTPLTLLGLAQAARRARARSK